MKKNRKKFKLVGFNLNFFYKNLKCWHFWQQNKNFTIVENVKHFFQKCLNKTSVNLKNRNKKIRQQKNVRVG
jgi:hypothetical protein